MTFWRKATKEVTFFPTVAENYRTTEYAGCLGSWYTYSQIMFLQEYHRLYDCSHFLSFFLSTEHSIKRECKILLIIILTM